jgi:hypothetical protein
MTMTENVRNSGPRIVAGVVAIAIALAISFWAHAHSPHMGFGEMLMNLDSYIIKEPFYSVIMIIAAITGVFGILAIVRGLQAARI